jgi:hypothetical protein
MAAKKKNDDLFFINIADRLLDGGRAAAGFMHTRQRKVKHRRGCDAIKKYDAVRFRLNRIDVLHCANIRSCVETG